MTNSQGPINAQNPNSQLGLKSLGFDWSLDIRTWGFHLVPRDDRLFDIFPELTRHRGFEVWEKWTSDTIKLITIKFQDKRAKPKHLKFSRQEIEKRLLQNQ